MPAPNFSDIPTLRTLITTRYPGSQVNVTPDQQLIIQLVDTPNKMWYTVTAPNTPETFASFTTSWNALPNTAQRDFQAIYDICLGNGWIANQGSLP